MNKRENPEINAGSMADIAFLLLIFFLVTTTMDNELGILKRLPDKLATPPPSIPHNERNVLEIIINHNDELMIENSEKIEFKNLRQLIIDFIDNGAGNDTEGNPCDWCDGEKLDNSSDHPSKAIITLQSGRNTSYGTYVVVQNEINAAYKHLRNKLSRSMYGITFDKLEINYKESKSASLKAKIKTIKDKYPVLISEITPQKDS